MHPQPYPDAQTAEKADKAVIRLLLEYRNAQDPRDPARTVRGCRLCPWFANGRQGPATHLLEQHCAELSPVQLSACVRWAEYCRHIAQDSSRRRGECHDPVSSAGSDASSRKGFSASTSLDSLHAELSGSGESSILDEQTPSSADVAKADFRPYVPHTTSDTSLRTSVLPSRLQFGRLKVEEVSTPKAAKEAAPTTIDDLLRVNLMSNIGSSFSPAPAFTCAQPSPLPSIHSLAKASPNSRLHTTSEPIESLYPGQNDFAVPTPAKGTNTSELPSLAVPIAVKEHQDGSRSLVDSVNSCDVQRPVKESIGKGEQPNEQPLARGVWAKQIRSHIVISTEDGIKFVKEPANKAGLSAKKIWEERLQIRRQAVNDLITGTRGILKKLDFYGKHRNLNEWKKAEGHAANRDQIDQLYAKFRTQYKFADENCWILEHHMKLLLGRSISQEESRKGKGQGEDATEPVPSEDGPEDRSGATRSDDEHAAKRAKVSTVSMEPPETPGHVQEGKAVNDTTVTAGAVCDLPKKPYRYLTPMELVERFDREFPDWLPAL